MDSKPEPRPAGEPETAKRESSAPQTYGSVNIQGDNAVVSQGQTGGITAQTVVVIQGASASQATLRLANTRRESNPDGTTTTIATLVLDSPFPVGNLALEVHGRTISEIEAVPARAGGMMTGHSGARPGFHFTNIPNASGTYLLRVLSREPERFEIVYNVE